MVRKVVDSFAEL